jgi:hypothetical protein
MANRSISVYDFIIHSDMVKVKKDIRLNVFIDSMQSVYCGRRRGYDVCQWINWGNGKPYGQREIKRIGNNYVDLCLN